MFLQSDYADPFLIAYALSHEDVTIVTEEVSARDSKKDIKLPDVCEYFGIRSIKFIQTDALTYVFQMKSRGQKAIDAKFPNGLPHSTLVTDRHQSYFKMKAKNHQVCLAHLLRNAEYLNELDTGQDWSRRFIRLIRHAIRLRKTGRITQRKIKILETKMKKLLGESLTHLDDEFESFKKGVLKVKDYLFTFLSNPNVPYDNNASERGIRKIKIKQKVSGCFRTDAGADDFAKLHSIAETAMKNGNSKYNAFLAVVQQ